MVLLPPDWVSLLQFEKNSELLNSILFLDSHCAQGMVFAINAVDSSAKNFTAFQSQAIQINGTSTAATTSPSATTSTTSGAGRLVGAGSGLVMGLVGAIFLLL